MTLSLRRQPRTTSWACTRPTDEPYSPECVEEEFSELRVDGGLRSSGLPLYSVVLFVPWRTDTALRRAYAASVMWHR
jgi:hypothetical protein